MLHPDALPSPIACPWCGYIATLSKAVTRQVELYRCSEVECASQGEEFVLMFVLETEEDNANT